MADMAKDRQDVPIWNAIEANNLKQALRLAEKRLAKKHTEYVEALVIYIRSRLTQLPEKIAVLIHLESLPTRKQLLSDLDAIELYDEALREVLPKSKQKWHEVIGELRWLFVKASPKNEEAALKCFKECVMQNDLQHARLIANSLEKSFPNSHPYIFWSITIMFLYSLDQSYPEKQRKIWGGLAMGQLGQLAAVSRQANDPRKLPVKAIHSPQELLLLHKLLETSGKQEQQLECLRDPSLGPDSSIAKGEWQLWRLRIQLAETAGEWQDVFDTAGALLKRARTKDADGQLAELRMSDWLIWAAYIRSAIELSDHKNTDAVTAELEAHLDPASGIDKSWLRNAVLAWVKFSFEKRLPFSQSRDRTATIEDDLQALSMDIGTILVVVKYLQQYGDASTAYNDLRPFAERLAIEERERLIAILKKNTIYSSKKQQNGNNEMGRSMGALGQNPTTTAEITQTVNSFKLIYLLTICQPELERSQSPVNKSQPDFICKTCSTPCKVVCCNCLEKFAVKTMKVYNSAIKANGKITQDLLSTDRHPADDLCILSAMALIKLALINNDSGVESLKRAQLIHLMQATLLLEYAWTHSKSNFQISLVLVKLYSYVGCGSLAARAFHRLALKQIQLDTLSYILFDRISSTHPHHFSHSPDGTALLRSPSEHFRKQQKLYARADEQISKNMWLAFKNGSYNAICELREFSQTLRHSMSLAMSVIESRRIFRLIPSDTTPMVATNEYGILPSEPEFPEHSFVDTNDYESLPNFESTGAPRFEKLLHSLPGPSDFRTRSHLRMEKLYQIFDRAFAPEPKEEYSESWLNSQLLMAIQETEEDLQNLEKSNSQVELLSFSEQFAVSAFDKIAHIMQLSLCAELWTMADFEKNLALHNNDLRQALEQHIAVIEAKKDLVPALSPTLHALHTAYDVGRAILRYNKYLRQPKIRVHSSQLQSNEKLVELAERLTQLVANKCVSIKKELDESGWIDRLLDSVVRSDEQSEASLPVVEALKELVDENFMEEWAGFVVESWRDSVVGLTYLKADLKI